MNCKAAAVLVGGKGTRLAPLISHVPKPLAPIGKDPFLFLLIRKLKATGYQHIVLLTGYQHDAIVEACKQGDALGVKLYYSQEFLPKGTGGALKQAQTILKNFSEFLLLNGDTFLEDFASIAEVKLEKAIGCIGVTQSKKNDRFGSLSFDPQTKKIKNFREKEKTNQGFVSAGIYKFSSRIFDFIPDETYCSLEQDVFPKLIHQNQLLKAHLLHGEFYDIGLPESYLQFVGYMKEKAWIP